MQLTQTGTTRGSKEAPEAAVGLVEARRGEAPEVSAGSKSSSSSSALNQPITMDDSTVGKVQQDLPWQNIQLGETIGTMFVPGATASLVEECRDSGLEEQVHNLFAAETSGGKRCT